MTADDLSTWLTDGLAAAKAGERAQARELLLRVVEADEHNLPAWLSLSGLVTTLEDREVCLENVLTLDPSNATAREGLELVRTQIAGMPEIEPESIFPHVETDELRAREARIKVDFSDDEFDCPWLCVYCGHLTGEDDRHCPKCKRKLYVTALKRERPAWLWMGWTASVVDAFYSAGALMVLLLILASALTAAKFDQQPIDIAQVLQLYVDQPSSLSAPAQAAVLNVLPREQFYLRIAYLVLVVLATIGLPTRRRVFHLLFIGTLVVAAAGLYLNFNLSRMFIAAAAVLTPLQRIVQALINELLGVFITLSSACAGLLLFFKTLLVFLMEDDFTRITERLWSVIDKNVREPSTGFIRAKINMKRDMWTLAAMYLRRCISLQPSMVDYHLALAESYAHLGRYRQSLEMLDQAERLQPGSTIIADLRRVIVEHQSKVNPMETTGGL